MKYSLLVIIIFLLNLNLYAAELSGKIFDQKSKKPVKNAAIGIKQIHTIKYSGADGKFKFRDLKPSIYKLTIVHPDYGKKVVKIKVKRDFRVKIGLRKYVYKTATKKEYYEKYNDRFGSQSIKQADIKDYPGRGVGDSLKLLQTLPGVGNTYSYATVPIVRGSNSLNDKYYIDDLPVDSPYHFVAGMFPVLSSISEEVIDEVKLIKGPYPLYFDDSIGSIIEIKTREVKESGVHGKVLIDPFIAAIPTVFFTAVPYKDLTIMTSFRRTYLDWVAKIENFNFYMMDHYLKIQYNIFSKHRLYVIAFGSDDRWYLRGDSSRSQFHTEAIKWEYLINKNVFLKSIVSHYRINSYLKNDDIRILYNPYHVRFFQMLSYINKKFYLKSGQELIYNGGFVRGNIDIEDISDFYFWNKSNTNSGTTNYIEGISYSIFIEPGFKVDKYWGNGGVRYKFYGSQENHSISFRGLLGVYVVDSTALYLGGGGYYAHPDFQYYVTSRGVDFKDIKSYNAILGLKTNALKYLLFQFEGYFSKFENMFSSTSDTTKLKLLKTFSQFNAYSDGKYGYATGFELYFKGAYKNIEGWISYSFSISRFSDKNNDFNGFYSDFDQSHILRIVLKARLGPWIPSIIWHVYTPVPHTPVVGSNFDGTDHDPIYGSTNSERDDVNHRIDLKLTYKSRNNHRFFIEFWNFYNHKNIIDKDFKSSRPNGQNNPLNVYDSDYIPVFLWIGMELCF